jgi:hypothetical protein
VRRSRFRRCLRALAMLSGIASPWWMDAQAAQTGQTVRVIGRYLAAASVLVGGVAPVVTAQGDCLIEFAMPALTGAQAVTVGGVSLGTIEGKGVLADPFGIGLGWADELDATAAEIINVKTDGRLTLHCVGDGATNDAPAFREALALAQSLGAATVYFPVGTFRIDDGTMCQVAPGTALKGAGRNLTTLQVGYRFTVSVAPTAGYYPIGLYGERIGMIGLHVQNLNGHSTPNGVIRPVTAIGLCFLIDCRFTLGNGKPITLTTPVDGAIRGNEFSSTNLVDGPLDVAGGQRLFVEGNAFAYRRGRVKLTMARRSVIRGNVLSIDPAYFVPLSEGGSETGGIEFSYGQEVLVAGNSGGFSSAPEPFEGYGELLMAQSSNLTEYRVVSTVASVAGTAVTVVGGFGTTDWYAPNTPQFRRHRAQVLTGAAAGQSRWIEGHDAATMTLESPIAGLAPGDRVNVNSMAAYRHTILDNPLSFGMTAVTVYSGGEECDAFGNAGTNSGPIYLRSDTRLDPLSGSGRTFHQPLWDCRAEGNGLTNTLGLKPACLSLSLIHVSGPDYPLMIKDVRLAGNTIVGIDDAPGPEVLASFDGVELVAISEQGLPFDPAWASGIVVAGNALSGAVLDANDVPYSLS